MSKSIPKRWIPYNACGEIIEGTRIICFKVPLKRYVQKINKDITEIWDVKAVLERIQGLKAVIDLTNTARYYNPEEFERAGVAYKKIMMAGRVIPPNRQIKDFMDTMDSFLEGDEDAVIGVHCTHGLNRTGFMVCRYMRDRLGIPAKEAIQRFEKARGYEMERANYIANILGKQPPPPYLDSGHDDDPKPAGKTRSTSLSAYDNIPDDDQNIEPDNDLPDLDNDLAKHDNDQTNSDNQTKHDKKQINKKRESRPRKRKRNKSGNHSSTHYIRNKSTNDQFRSKKKKIKNDKGKKQYGSRLNGFAFDYRFDY